jgi:hypothetical protein
MSGFLSEDSLEKADSLIQEAFPIDDDGDGFVGDPVETQAEEPTEDIEASSESLESDVKEEGGEEEYAEGHRVPYNRFKSVLDARNGYKDEIESLRERNRQLETYLSSKPSEPQKEEEDLSLFEDDFQLEDDYGLSDSGYDNKRVSQLETQMHDMRVDHYKQQLTRDMDIIKEKYPSVPPESVLKAVANDPSTNVFQVAETFHNFLVEREEAAIQRYLKENPGASVEASPKAAPRPRKSGGSDAPGSSRVPKDKRPRQMKDVRHALLNYVKDNNIF